MQFELLPSSSATSTDMYRKKSHIEKHQTRLTSVLETYDQSTEGKSNCFTRLLLANNEDMLKQEVVCSSKYDLVSGVSICEPSKHRESMYFSENAYIYECLGLTEAHCVKAMQHSLS